MALERSASAFAAAASTYLAGDFGTLAMHPNFAFAPNYTNYYLPGSGAFGGMPDSPALGPDYMGDYKTGRHFGGVNMAYADGHVKWLLSDKVLEQSRNFYKFDGTKNAFDPAAPPA